MPASLNRQSVQHLQHVVNKMLKRRGAFDKLPFLTTSVVDVDKVQRYNCIIYVEKRGIDMSKEHNSEKENTYYSAQPRFENKGPSKLKQQFNRGATAFMVVACSIVFYFALLRLTNISFAFGAIWDALAPVIYGCVIAYMLTPIVKKVDEKLYPFLVEKLKNKKSAFKVSRSCGIFVSLLFLVALITILCNLLIPELYKSIKNLLVTLPGQVNYVVLQIEALDVSGSELSSVVKSVLEEAINLFQNWFRTDFMEDINRVMTNLTEGVFNVVGGVFDALIGVIVSVYVMYGRETFSRQCKKIVYALFSSKRANLILHLGNKSNEIFGGFIIGKIIDSIIIGFICFFVLTIIKMPYTMLVSVIVGVTNVIPFFGPFIGAIPCAILIILNEPMKGVYFIIFILILQQFDGNILGPKILGDTTGLSSFWVITAILLGGGLFGFAGMLLGVPTFAVIYYILQLIIESKLEQKNLPTNSRHYHPMSYVDEYGRFRYSKKKVYRQTKETSEIEKENKKLEAELDKAEKEE